MFLILDLRFLLDLALDKIKAGLLNVMYKETSTKMSVTMLLYKMDSRCLFDCFDALF